MCRSLPRTGSSGVSAAARSAIRSPELSQTWTSRVRCLVPAAPRAGAPGPSGTGPALPAPQALCRSAALPARCATRLSLPAPVRSPLPTTGWVCAQRPGHCCHLAAQLRVQKRPEKGSAPPECCQRFITLHVRACLFGRMQRRAQHHERARADQPRAQHHDPLLAQVIAEAWHPLMLDERHGAGRSRRQVLQLVLDLLTDVLHRLAKLALGKRCLSPLDPQLRANLRALAATVAE